MVRYTYLKVLEYRDTIADSKQTMRVVAAAYADYVAALERSAGAHAAPGIAYLTAADCSRAF